MVFHRILDFKTRLDFYPGLYFFYTLLQFPFFFFPYTKKFSGRGSAFKPGYPAPVVRVDWVF
jgi:hypothetical protein